MSLASGWPTETDVQARTGIALTASEGVYSTSYSLNVTELLARAYWHVAERCHRDTLNERGFDEAAITDETHDGGLFIRVKHPPIVSVSDVSWDGESLSYANEEYKIFESHIQIIGSVADQIESYGGYREDLLPRCVTVDYTGGFSDSDGTHFALPHDLKEIVLEICCRWLLRADQRQRVDKGALSAAVGNAQIKYVKDEELLADLYERIDRLPNRINVRGIC